MMLPPDFMHENGAAEAFEKGICTPLTYIVSGATAAAVARINERDNSNG